MPYVDRYLWGATCSGLHEAKFAAEFIKNGEIHTYSPAFKEDDFEQYWDNEPYENELKYTKDIYDEIGLYEDVKDYVEYNANRALANLGYPGYFEDKEINPIIENAMNTNTKNHDFFSVKGDGYVVSMNVESIEDEDFIFE